MTYSQLRKKIGGLIKLYRARKGYKLKDLASELDVVYQRIQNYEKGDYLPRFYTLYKIIEILEIPGNKIFSKENDRMDLQELSKTYSKYDKFIKEFAEDEKLRDIVKQYIKEKYKQK